MTIMMDMQREPEYTDEWALLELLLSPGEIKRLKASSDLPYEDDIDLVLDYRMKHGLNAFQEKKLEEVGATVLSQGGKPGKLESVRQFVDMLADLRNRMTDHIEARLEASRIAGVKLRLFALQHHLQLTDKEREAFAYMIYTSIGLHNLAGGNSTLKPLMECCRMSLNEILDFINDDRRHIREMLVELHTNGDTSLLDRKFTLSGEFNKIVAGRPLNNQDLLKVEGTVLAELLAEEGIVLITPKKNTEEKTESRFLQNEKKDCSRADDHELEIHHDFPPEAASSNLSVIETEQQVITPRQDEELQPYQDDQEYLDDQFAYFLAKFEYLEKKNSDTFYSSLEEKTKGETLRDLKGKEKMLLRRCEIRLQLTRDEGRWYPRLERLAEKHELCTIEKNILIILVGAVLIEGFEDHLSGMRGIGPAAKVQDMFKFFAGTLKEQIRMRRYFYRDAPLVREGMIRVEGDFGRDIQEYSVDIDQKALDYIAGLDVELSNIVDGSHLYRPAVRLSHVILPEDQKKTIVETVKNYSNFIKNRKQFGLDDVIQYGRSIVMLFHGPPGTGKTMMANALAHHLGKKILLINFPSLGSFDSDKLLSFFFRVATVNDAIIFFDECEAVFESRETGNRDLTMLLTAIERHEGTIIMATNRPFQLDKAMHRRITMDIEFNYPDPCFRERIWQEHLPSTLPLADDVDLRSLAVKYEFSGGYIKNAVLAALSGASSRQKEKLVLRMSDLEQGAKLQMRGHLSRGDFDRKIVPKNGMDALILPAKLNSSLREVIHFEKARNVLFGQWGFEDVTSYGSGNGVLFHGPPGIGKTMAAEAIGYEIGRPLMVINIAELLSKYVGETAKNIEAVFQEARNNSCIPVFDEAEGLFAGRSAGNGATDRYANVDVNILLHHMERFPGMVILTTNLIDNIDQAIFRRLKFILEFKKPDRTLRRQLWQQLIPARTPQADDIDFKALASQYEFTGGNIKNCIFKAAARAALRPEQERRIEMADLIIAAGEEYGVQGEKRIGF